MDIANAASSCNPGDTCSCDPPHRDAQRLAIYPSAECTFEDCKTNRAERIQIAKLEWEFTADSVPQLIFLLDREDHILRANRTIEQWGLGQVADAVGRKIHDLLHPNCKAQDCHLKDIWRHTVGNAEQDFAVEFQTEDNFLHRHLNLHFHLHRSMEHSDAGFIVAVISDISALKQAESKLREVNDELERRIEESTFALISSNIRLKQEIEQHKRMEEQLERSREEYSQLVEAMDEGLAILDKQGRITYVNKQFCDTIGRSREELLGRTLIDYAADENRSALERHMRERINGGVTTYVANLNGVDGRKFWVKISPTLLIGKQGESTGSYAVITDDIEQINVKQRLRKSEDETEDNYDNVPYGYHTLDSNGVFIKINNTKAKWLGYSKDEMIGKMKFLDILTPMSAQQYDIYLPRLKTVGYLRDLEIELVRKNGNIMTALLSAAAIRDSEGRFVMTRAIVYDISYRKNAEQALRESEHTKRLLAAQVMSAQEKERKRIASELHDGIGQSLSAIKFYVENAIRGLNDQTIETSTQIFRKVVPKLQEAIEEIRNISMDLRPSLLDDIGTLATLSWFCRNFQSIYESIRVELRIDIQENEIPASLKVAIFRIVQEAMNNCAKHGHAECIYIGLSHNGREIELAVEDNGRGFDFAEVKAKNKRIGRGMGLVSMRERAEFTGGSFSIESATGKGTSLRVNWPYQETSASSRTEGTE